MTVQARLTSKGATRHFVRDFNASQFFLVYFSIVCISIVLFCCWSFLQEVRQSRAFLRRVSLKTASRRQSISESSQIKRAAVLQSFTFSYCFHIETECSHFLTLTSPNIKYHGMNFQSCHS